MWNGIYHGMLRGINALKLFTAAGKGSQIKIETDHLLIIRRRPSSRAWCQQCAREVDMVRVEEATALAESSKRTLRDSVTGEKWHVSCAPGGAQLICLDSLLKSL